ncbi:MAG: hypothetical protein CR986_08035 [Ignavibacteriae bacterium]|nr:MAG: hypothetical protein CR986_08035 [Ignavibacteriota bacterium]
MKITLKDIFNIPNSRIYNPDSYKSASYVSIDTRTIKKNSIFVAIKGKNFDGHNYIKEAIKKGATSVVINNRKLKDFDDVEVAIISVKNTLDAYGELAKIWRNKLSAKVISITGSNGKTTTKEILSRLLEIKYKVHKTEANNNNQIGVPLTILSAKPKTDFIVLEHGTNHPGEIEYTAKIAEPDFAVITNISNSHLQYLKSKEKVLEEKLSLFKYVKDDGYVFINNDDALLASIKRNYKNKITYGLKGRCTVKGKVKIKNSITNIIIDEIDKTIETTLNLLGKANAQNFLAASAIALKVGVTESGINKAAKEIKAVKGRLEKIKNKNSVIINDTYNSNPESARIAFEVLDEFKDKNKILIFGDMFELGKDADKFHKDLAANINSTNINEVYTIGRKAKLLNQNLNKKITAKHFTNRVKLIDFLKELNIENSVLLFKGSRGMKMEEFLNVVKDKIK